MAQRTRERSIAIYSGVFVALLGSAAVAWGVRSIVAGGAGPSAEFGDFFAVVLQAGGFATAVIGLAVILAGTALAVFGFRRPRRDDRSDPPRRTSIST